MTEIRYFHPSGKTIPNGSHIQKGGFLLECRQNKRSFIGMDSPNVGVLVMGGIIPGQDEIEKNIVGSGVKSGNVEFGNFFFGSYANGEILFDSGSLCVKITDVSLKEINTIVSKLKHRFPLISFLLRHNASMKIYLH